MHDPAQTFQMYPDNLYILGSWLSYERAKQGYSLRGLARGSNITASLISAIENQKTKAHLDTLKILFEAMHHSFVTDEAYLSSIHENIQALYYAVYDQNDIAVKDLYNALKPHFIELKYSALTVDLILAEAFMQIHIEKTNVSDAFLAMGNHLDHLSLVQKQRFYINLGYYHLALNDKRSAEDAFFQVVECHRESRAHAVALTMLARLASQQFSTVQAAEYAHQASIGHARYSNLFRKVEADLIAIQSHIELRQLSKAESILKNLSYVLVESNQRYWPALQSFKAFMHYRKGNYPACIHELEALPERDLLQSVLLAQAYFKHSDVAQAKAIFKSLQAQYPGDQPFSVYHLTQLFMTQLGESSEDLEASMHYFIENYKALEQLHAVQSLLSIVSHVAHQQKNTEILYALQKISLSLMHFDKNEL